MMDDGRPDQPLTQAVYGLREPGNRVERNAAAITLDTTLHRMARQQGIPVQEVSEQVQVALLSIVGKADHLASVLDKHPEKHREWVAASFLRSVVRNAWIDRIRREQRRNFELPRGLTGQENDGTRDVTEQALTTVVAALKHNMQRATAEARAAEFESLGQILCLWRQHIKMEHLVLIEAFGWSDGTRTARPTVGPDECASLDALEHWSARLIGGVPRRADRGPRRARGRLLARHRRTRERVRSGVRSMEASGLLSGEQARIAERTLWGLLRCRRD